MSDERPKPRGFWTTTPSGVTAHVQGDPDMSDESLEALQSLIDLAANTAWPDEGYRPLDEIREDVSGDA